MLSVNHLINCLKYINFNYFFKKFTFLSHCYLPQSNSISVSFLLPTSAIHGQAPSKFQNSNSKVLEAGTFINFDWILFLTDFGGCTANDACVWNLWVATTFLWLSSRPLISFRTTVCGGNSLLLPNAKNVMLIKKKWKIKLFLFLKSFNSHSINSADHWFPLHMQPKKLLQWNARKPYSCANDAILNNRLKLQFYLYEKFSLKKSNFKFRLN